MLASVSAVIFHVIAAVALLTLPGMALLAISAPGRSLGLFSRITIAPGITIAVTVLLFVWCDLLHIRLGPPFPWLMLAVSGVVLGVTTRRSLADRLTLRFSARINLSEWSAALGLIAVLAIFFAVRFRATWGWCVPPGVDTEQHTMIVRLLMEHRGLFTSWAPYSDAETFTYHFGFHAITTAFGWLMHLDAPDSVYIMGRVVAAAAAASLFGLVRLWTRNAWAGVFAAAFWEVSSNYFYLFEVMGRWAILAGLPCLTSGLVLLSLYLQPATLMRRAALGLLCSIVAGGLVLTQYKSAIIFTVLTGSLFVFRCAYQLFKRSDRRLRWLARLICRIAAVGLVALLLAAPRLHTVMEAEVGRYLKKIVLEAPAASSSNFDHPTLSGWGIIASQFSDWRKALVFSLAIAGLIALAKRRPSDLWFPVGWMLITLLMNPALIGSRRLGLIDEIHWTLAVDCVLAAMAGLFVGITIEYLRPRSSLLSTAFIGLILLVVSLRGAMRLPTVYDSVRYVMPDDLRLMGWIRQNVPDTDLIAGRVEPEHGEMLGRDAMMWLPHFTGHRTNHISLAAALEKGPTESRRRSNEFSLELYKRDMSTAASAAWMQDQGFPWFYVGVLERRRDVPLLEQLARNPALEVARQEGNALIYRVR